MKRYLKIKEGSTYRKQKKEKMDCSVIAVSIACRSKYKSTHNLFADLGRKSGRRTPRTITSAAIACLGFRADAIKNLKQKNGSAYTPKTIGLKLSRGYYICFCRGHMFALVNGDVEDWTSNRNHRITEAYKIVRKSNKLC